MRRFRYLQIAAMGLLTLCGGCSEDPDIASHHTALDLSVKVSNDPLSKGFFEGSSFADGETIGLFFEAKDGGAYDQTTYQNLAYVSSNSEAEQKWSGGPVYLSSTVGRAFCYWPYIEGGVENYTAVPVEAADQIDYMCSGWITGISNSKPLVRVDLSHAQTAIQLNVKRGSYTGKGKLTAVKLRSNALGASGKLDLSTGKFSGVVTGDISSRVLDIELNTTPSAVGLMALPLGSTAYPVKVTFTIDDRYYSIDCPADEAFKPGYRYSYTVTLNGVGLSVSTVTVNPWINADQDGGPVLEPSLEPGNS